MHKLIIWLIFASSLMSCKKEDAQGSKVLDFQTFRLMAPENWNKFSLQGIDSQVGGLTNGKDTIQYDYGWYSYNLKNQTTATHIRTTTTIDGRSSLIVQPKHKGKGITGVFIKVDSLTKLTMYGNDMKAQSTALKIFESVKF